MLTTTLLISLLAASPVQTPGHAVPIAVAGGSASLCPADLNGDGAANVDDIDLFVSAFLAGDLLADFNGDGALNVDDIDGFVSAFLTFDQDSDFDQLSDCAEAALGTDPFNPDTDDDGLTDGAEVLGVPGVDLPGMGANPLRRTIFVETDWFAGTFEGQFRDFRPTNGMVNRIVGCFANAPTPNPDGSTGIDIFVDRGQGGAFTGGNQLPGEPAFITFDNDFNAYQAAHFDPNREGIFHYCIFANRYNSSTNGSSGIAEIDGDDFMVTLSTFFSGYNGAATFVHEIGHNLGLRHGGFENRNYKPNYNSVMNYRFQFGGIDITGDAIGNGVIDYSAGTNISINENAVFEPEGVDGVNPIDFNRSASIDAAPYAYNINCPGFGTQPCGTQGSCYDSTCNTLHDNADWFAINWDRLNDFDRVGAIEVIECENAPE